MSLVIVECGCAHYRHLIDCEDPFFLVLCDSKQLHYTSLRNSISYTVMPKPNIHCWSRVTISLGAFWGIIKVRVGQEMAPLL